MQNLSEYLQVRPFNTNSYIQIMQKPSIQESVQSILHSEVQQRSSNHQNPQIEFKFFMGNCEYVIEQQMQIKYDDFLSDIQQRYFPQLNAENPLILTQGWNLIIPQSNDSTIEETIPNMNSLLMVDTLNHFLSDFAEFLNSLQDTIEAQQKKFSKLQGQITKDQEEMEKNIVQENQLQTEYNQLEQEYEFLELNYRIYLQQNNVLQNNNKILKDIIDLTLKLMTEKEEVQNQNQNLSELFSQQKCQIQAGISQTQLLQNEKLLLKQQLVKVLKQQQQQQQQGEQNEQEFFDEKFKQFQIQEQKIEFLKQKSQKNQLKQHQIESVQDPKLTKQNTFIKNIQKYFCKNLNNKNQLIFENQWNQIIPYPVILANTMVDTNVNLKNQSLYYISTYIKHHQDQLQDTYTINQQQILDLQDLIINNQQKIQKQIKSQKKLSDKQQTLRDNKKLLESNYSKYQEIIQGNIIMKNNSRESKMMTQYILILTNEKNFVEQQNLKLAQLCQSDKYQIESQAQKIQNLQNEVLSFKDQLSKFQQKEQLNDISEQQLSILKSEFEFEQSQSEQFQSQVKTNSKFQYQLEKQYYQKTQQQFQQKYIEQQKQQKQQEEQQSQKSQQQEEQLDKSEQLGKCIEQQQNSELVSKIQQTENQLYTEQKQIQDEDKFSKNYQDFNQLYKINQKSQSELRQSIQDTSDLKIWTQINRCTYCKQCCTEYIQLPCLHPYHKQCLEKIGKKAYNNGKYAPKCMCSENIQIELFTTETQQNLLKCKLAQMPQQQL